jgi:uncharacterized protein DUF6484
MKSTPEILLELPPLAQATENPSPLRDLIARRPKVQSSAPLQPPSCVIGDLRSLNETGVPLVDFTGNPHGDPIAAQSIVPLSSSHVGNNVLLLFENGEPDKPIIVGLIKPPTRTEPPKPVEVKLDGEQLVFTADKEIVLRCGNASITLTRAGKVLIRGAYLLSRSSAANRIKGGSVQIN